MDTTAISISIDVLTNDSISFYRKVSSENNYDYLNFFIDNVKVARWAGTKSWAKVAYAITPGHHILKWNYIKDQSTASGSDCAWLDFIVFPAIQSFVGINEPKTTIISDFKVYPNPASDYINLNYTLLEDNTALLRIYNSGGQMVYNEEIEKQNAGDYTSVINTSYLNKGIYYLTLQSKNQILTQKLILIK